MLRKGLVLIAIIAILLAQNVMAQTSKPSVSEIAQFTKWIIQDNPKFTNPNLVYPGDTVLVADVNRVVIYTVGKWSPHSTNGCLWQIATMHLNNGLKTTQVSAATVKNPSPIVSTAPVENPPQKIAVSPINPPKVTQKQELKWQFDGQQLLLAILVIHCLLIILLLIYLIYALEEHWSKLEPVIKGGLPDDPAAAIDLINQNYTRLRDEDNLLKKLSRGHLQHHFGPKRIKVQMAFSNGIQETLLREDEPTYCAEYTGGTVYYFRLCCGNLYVLSGGEPFILPEGWSFIPEASVERTKDQINQEAKMLLIKKQEENKNRR